MFTRAFAIILCIIYTNSLASSNQLCSVFQYANYNGANIGKAEFKNDYSGTYRLSVNLSVASYGDQLGNVKLDLRTPVNDILKGMPLVYYIYFPTQRILPKPTRIEFNGRVYCSRPPEELTPGNGVTNFWASTVIKTGAPQLRPQATPEPEIEYKPAAGYNTLPPILNIIKPQSINSPSTANSVVPEIIYSPNPSDYVNPNYNVVQQPDVVQQKPQILQQPHVVQQPQYLTANIPAIPHQTIDVNNSSSIVCTNTTNVEQLGASQDLFHNPSTTHIKNSTYFYRCKETHVSNQNIQTITHSRKTT